MRISEIGRNPSRADCRLALPGDKRAVPDLFTFLNIKLTVDVFESPEHFDHLLM